MTEKRFKEIISTQKVIDTVTNKEYDCLLDNDLFDLINKIAEENEQSKKHREELFYRERDAKNDWRKLKYENEQLKKALDDFKGYGDEEFKETGHINSIYKKEGFNGVIDYAKEKLQCYGLVKEVEKGLWVMVTSGWSDNEFFIHCSNNLLSNFGRLHYRAYEKGGAFYYTEEPRADVEIHIKQGSD